MTPEMFLSMWSSGMSASDKADMKRHLNEVVSAAISAERERCAIAAIDSLSSEMSTPATRLAVESAAHSIRALK